MNRYRAFVFVLGIFLLHPRAIADDGSGTAAIPVNQMVVAVPAFYQEVASAYGIPAVTLYAVALTESEYRFKARIGPWPWVANIKGDGVYYRSRREAQELCHGELQLTGASLAQIDLQKLPTLLHGRSRLNAPPRGPRDRKSPPTALPRPAAPFHHSC